MNVEMEVSTRYNDDRGMRGGKSRIFFFIKNESIFDNLMNRRNRPVQFWRSLVPEILMRFNMPPTTKVRWSAKAGCQMCPCSPGFWMSKPFFKNGQIHDIFVTITVSESPVIVKE